MAGKGTGHQGPVRRQERLRGGGASSPRFPPLPFGPQSMGVLGCSAALPVVISLELWAGSQLGLRLLP